MDQEERATIDILKQTNPWWDNENFTFNLLEREEYLSNIMDRKDRLIQILIGARRVGKTFILKSVINHLLLEGAKEKNVLYISCDAREVRDLGIKRVIDIYIKQFKINLKQRIYIFLDEVQEVKDWQSDVKYFYDNLSIQFYLTGSSSLILSSKTSKLTGRFILHQVLPLSFKEYLLFTNTKIIKDKKNNEKILEEYLQTGGYPEYVLLKNRQYLMDAIESTLYRELLEVYGIRNPKLLRTLIEYLSDKVTNYVSANKIRQDLKVDDKTAAFYLQYLQDIYLLYPVYKYGRSYKISKNSIPKYYFNDTGILNVFSLYPKIGQLTENVVFLHLLRKSRSKQSLNIFYDVINNIEIDFRAQNQLYEVKFRDGEDNNLEKYQLINNDNVTFIRKEVDDMFVSMLPSQKQITLLDFLQS